jgi:predicted O-linked N-acetylglucosamine transferase (SPINDLY family)
MATISEALAIAARHHQAGRLQAAEQIYRQILAVEPNHADAMHLLGVMASQLGKHVMAVEYIGRAIGLKGDVAAFHNHLGTAYLALRRIPEAVACYRRALELKPDDADAHNNLGALWKDQEKLDEALACYRQALELKPDYAEAHSNLGNVLKDQGSLDEAIACYHRALELKPDYAQAHSNLVYTEIFCPGYDAQTLYEEHRRWNRQHAEPLAKFIQPHLIDRSPDRRLRIGYVSPDFRSHAESFFTIPLFSAHDHQNFDIFCYADVIHPDGITARLRSCADSWRNITGLSHEQVAQRIRHDGIDILVDLTMHMARNRLLVFARKPAPVQVSWLAYPGTTGLSTIDYRLTDPYLDPPGLNDRYYAEESVRLPDSFWCYDPLTNETPVNALPALEKGYLTFGSLNNFCKVNAAVLKLWAQVLKAVDRSQLLLLAFEGRHRQRALDLLEQEGVAPGRVTLVAPRPRPQYLELYHRTMWGLTRFPTPGTPPASTRYGWACPWSRWKVKRRLGGRGYLC